MTFNEVDRRAYQVLMDAGVDRLHVDLHQIIKSTGKLKTMSYSKAAKKIDARMQKNPPSKDGLMVEIGDGEYCILFNDEHHVHRRRWTIAHELGHYFLGHMKQRHATPAQKEWHEKEANRFAQTLLTPMPIIRALGEEDPCIVSWLCFVSQKAAECSMYARKYTESEALVNHMQPYIQNTRSALERLHKNVYVGNPFFWEDQIRR